MQSEFVPQSPAPAPVASAYVPEREKTQEEILREEGWVGQNFSNGVMPDCYNYSPSYGSIENELQVSVGGGTDVVIKVMSTFSNQCVRYVYINSGAVYSIRNIPEGEYYLKIAYGKNWVSKTSGRQCLGKFTSGALYQKGEEILDFNKQFTVDGYQIQNYRLSLDVQSGRADNSFNSNSISEDDFNN
ncbi:hypothetical protein [Pedobacter aquatilis]|uniref:hypothetical protein n=1 Tax=Pedobacter aquatilis TaxID=351343 RepID=UPI002931E36C|nr:hypothetical protein [Pedobacter aquatilis]